MSRHLIHRAMLTPRSDTLYDADGQPIEGYGDPVAGVHCRLVDLDDTEVADARQAGTILYTDALLLPLSAIVAPNDKVTTITLASDGAVIDAGPFEVVDVAVANADAPQFRRALIKRAG